MIAPQPRRVEFFPFEVEDPFDDPVEAERRRPRWPRFVCTLKVCL